MTSNSIQVFRQNDLKSKTFERVIQPSDLSQERGKANLNLRVSDLKSNKRFKPQKKFQKDNKELFGDLKIEDVFLNSEYFKHQSCNPSTLSFCSGHNGEYRWTIDSKSDTSTQSQRQKSQVKGCAFPRDFPMSGPTLLNEKHTMMKYRRNEEPAKESSQEKAENLLENFLSGKESMDRDLITLITKQMFLAERELQITRRHLMETISKLNERDLEIIQLHEQIRNLKRFEKLSETKGEPLESRSASKTSEDYQKLFLASEKLKKQVNDMEEFLNDYGLVWVGDKEPKQKPDFDKIIKNFQQLNTIASQPKIIQTRIGAKFELPRAISVALYSNGLLLRGTDFREYSKVATNIFLQDVEDGYFPSELQDEFPEGVPFEVTDRRNELYNGNFDPRTFQGLGNRLGSTFENKSPSLVFLSPMKDIRSHVSPPAASETVDKYSLRNYKRKQCRNPQEGIRNSSVSCYGETKHSHPDENDRGKAVALKVRFGKRTIETFVLVMHEQDRLIKFLEHLEQKTAEIASAEETTASQTDYELHIYGRPPIRLNDNLHRRLRELEITDNCLINVTEI